MATTNITITNGSGSSAIKAGTYSVTVSATGYDNSTLSPTTFTATAEAGSGTFTITATGTLTINVNETGASGGTPVTSGTIIMSDNTGNTEYGSSVTIDSSGNATFNNVPYGDTSTPYTLYFKQLTTDEGHNISTEVLTVSMQASTQTAYIQNTPIATQTFSLTDGTYTNLPIASATLTLSDS